MCLMSTTVNRYMPEEDKRILEDYWDPKRRKAVAESMADRHPARSVQFRYFQLLKLLNLGGSPTYRRMMEKHEKGEFELPFTIDELVEKVHSGEAHEAQRRAKRKAKSEKKAAPKAKAAPAPVTPVSPIEELLGKDKTVSIVYSEDIAQMMSSLTSLEKRMATLEERGRSSSLTDFFTLVAKAAQYQDRLPDIDKLVRENERLRKERDELEKKYRAKVAEFDEIYQKLNDIFGRYLRLTSVKKAMSLEDFIDQIGTVVDRFGNVVGLSTREKGVRGV